MAAPASETPAAANAAKMCRTDRGMRCPSAMPVTVVRNGALASIDACRLVRWGGACDVYPGGLCVARSISSLACPVRVPPCYRRCYARTPASRRDVWAVGRIVRRVARKMSARNEFSVFLDDDKRQRILHGLFDNFYAESDG